MLWIEPGLYVRIVELEHGPRPLPLSSGFSCHLAYRVLGCFSPAETSEAWLILSNDRNEIWFICNRHVRTVGIYQHKTAFSFELQPKHSQPSDKVVKTHNYE